MGSFAGVNALLPGRNPTGTSTAWDYTISPSTGSTSGQNPVLPPTNAGPGSTQTNPYSPGSVVPTFGINSGPSSPTSLTGLPAGAPAPKTSFQSAQTGPFASFFSGMTQSGINDMFHELNKTYGEGTASLIMNFLMSGAGFNQNAINNIFASLQPQINRGEENLMEQFSTSGNRFGSGAQIGIGDFLSQVNLNEGQIETQMYEQSVNDFINTLMGVAGGSSKRIASTPSTLDNILSGIGLGTSAAGGASSLISAINPNADTSILDAIAGFGAGL